MNPTDRIKLAIGNLMIALAEKESEIETLHAQVRELEDKLAELLAR